MAPVRLRENEEAVSVIVGTLLLILVAVIAATGLAIMVSGFQKEDMERQSHLRSVEHENLGLSYIELVNNRTFWEEWSNGAITSSENWSTLNLTIRNLNIEDSYVIAISVNDRYAKNYTCNGVDYSPAKRLLVAARKSREDIQINFTSSFGEPLFVGTGEALEIQVMTSLYNTFERTFEQPTPVMHLNIETEDVGFVERDLLVLDGSASFDDGAVTAWNWTIEDGSKAVPAGNWSDAANVTTSFAEGRKATVRLGSPGPFRVKLTVRDDTGMTSSSHHSFIPASQMFNPPANLQVMVEGGNKVNATVLDMGGQPVNGVVVNFVKTYDVYGNLTLNPWSCETNADGAATSTKLGGAGSIRVTAANVPPVDVALEL